jgi:superfamily I DNA/RNA helicase
MAIKLSDLRKRATATEESNQQRQSLYEEEFKSSLIIQDESQHQILTSKDNKYLVTGPAGSGKTILAMIKARSFEKSAKSYCFIVYTKALERFLCAKMRQNQFKNPNLKIYHLDEIKKKSNRTTLKKYKYIIIDEVQDLSRNDLDLFLKDKNAYFLYGDNAQELYKEKNNNFNSINYIIQKTPIKHFTLNRSFRVPRNIANFAKQLDKSDNDLAENCYNQGGELPIIIEMNSAQQELNYIANTIRTQKWENTAILLKTNKDVKNFYASFHPLMDCECKYQDDSTGINHDFMNLDFLTNYPKIMTYHSSKGLEFDHVFIPQCSDLDPIGNPVDKKLSFQEALFVAVTRAKINLIISYINGYKASILNSFNPGTYIYKKCD